jgi:hypothetical protein
MTGCPVCPLGSWHKACPGEGGVIVSGSADVHPWRGLFCAGCDRRRRRRSTGRKDAKVC